MYELIAQGEKPELRWRRTLPTKTRIELGRTTRPWSVGWDSQISRLHFSILLKDQQLEVEKHPDATNPIFFRGNAAKKFTISAGQHFVVGQTTFRFASDRAMATLDLPNPISQKTYSPEFLQKVHYRDADRRIDVLNQLPDVISSAGNEQDLLNRMINILMVGIPTATAIGVVRTDRDDEEGEIEIVHWDRRLLADGDFKPSGGLIRQSIQSRETVLHIWSDSRMDPANHASPTEFTLDLDCLLYTSPSPRDLSTSRMPSSA